MNYFAHSIMYSYYAIVSYGYRLPKWFSIFVTTVQTLQMFFGVLISFFIYKIKFIDNLPLVFLIKLLKLKYIKIYIIKL